MPFEDPLQQTDWENKSNYWHFSAAHDRVALMKKLHGPILHEGHPYYSDEKEIYDDYLAAVWQKNRYGDDGKEYLEKNREGLIKIAAQEAMSQGVDLRLDPDTSDSHAVRVRLIQPPETEQHLSVHVAKHAGK